jgi:organic hydroperoxide reductase OsmC/OhrA
MSTTKSSEEYEARITYVRDWEADPGDSYSRDHVWEFDGGARVHASASPHIVPVPQVSPSAVDPEEAFVAAIASCHMLFFLNLAQRAGYPVTRYEDRAVGKMEKLPCGQMAITGVELSPAVTYRGDRPAAAIEARLHEEAHHKCFIANSVRSEISIRTRSP